MSPTTIIRRYLLLALAFACVALGVWLALSGGEAQLLREAVGVDDAGQRGVGGVLRVARAIQKPALVAALSVVPLILIAAGVLFYVGSRNGLRLLAGVALGAALLASIGGLAA
jgi:hypothetical protein